MPSYSQDRRLPNKSFTRSSCRASGSAPSGSCRQRLDCPNQRAHAYAAASSLLTRATGLLSPLSPFKGTVENCSLGSR